MWRRSPKAGRACPPLVFAGPFHRVPCRVRLLWGVRGFTLEKDRLCFETATGPIVMPKGARVLVVLGDLGGRLVGKVARQASMQSARSVAEQAGLSAAEKYKTIFQGLPVVDLYILPKGFAAQQAEAVGPLRLLPGKFSPDGLGEAKTPSTVQNLDRTLRAVKGLAGWFRLETDFGLFSLPGCALESGREPAVVQRNLRALREYGRHLLAILQQGSQNASAKTHAATQTDGADRASSQAHSPGGSEVQPAAAAIATAAATATAGIAALSGAAVGVVAAPLSAGNVPQASPDKADDLGPMETVEPERDEAALREVGVLPPPPAFDVQGHIVRIGAKNHAADRWVGFLGDSDRRRDCGVCDQRTGAGVVLALWRTKGDRLFPGVGGMLLYGVSLLVAEALDG